MKTNKSLLSIAVLLTAATTFANQIILIDFASVGGSGGTGWNNLPNLFDRGQTLALNFTNGDTSGLSIGPFRSQDVEGADGQWNNNTSTNLGLEESDFISAVPWATPGAINDLWLSAASTTTGLYIQGLEANTEYKIDFIGAVNTTERLADITFSLFDSNNVSGGFTDVITFEDYSVRFNPANVTQYPLTVLSFSFTTAASGQNALRYIADGTSAINAMQITVIPEPSTIVLSLLALGSVVLFRRRK